MLLLLLSFSQAAAPQPDIRTDPLPGGGYHVVAVVPGARTPHAAAEAILPVISKLCKDGATPHWATVDFGLLKGDKAGAARLTGDIACGPPLESFAKPAKPDPAWKAKPADEAAVRAVSDRYFAAKDAGRVDAMWDLLSPMLQQGSGRAGWARLSEGYLTAAGPLRSRRLTRLSWFNDPPGADVHAIFARVDYVAQTEKMRVCGFLLWMLQSDGRWVLHKDQVNALPESIAAARTPEELARMRAAMRCVD
jgi:hypothetical protein